MDCSMPGFPVLHYLLKFAQIHVHCISDAIQPSHPLLPSSPSAFNLSQHQGLFQWVDLHIRWPMLWNFSFSISASSNEYSRLISFETAWFDLIAIQFSSVQLLSGVQLFVTPGTGAHQASLSITNSQSLFKLMSIELVMPSNHLIFCHPLILLPSIFPSIRVLSNESALHTRWPKFGSSASASVLPMNI